MKTIITFSSSHIRALVFFCIILFCYLQVGYTQPVTLDPTFGQNGIIEIPHSSLFSEIRLLDFDKSGNIIAVGYTWENNKCYLMIVKTNSDGILDLNFGDNGIVRGSEALQNAQLGLKITNENKIFITGNFYAEQYGVFRRTYLQFNEDGSIDETFGDNGQIIINSGNFPLYSLNTESADFILFGGYDGDDPMHNPLIFKRNYDGSIDETFGENGVVYLTDHETYRITPNAIKILGDQSILIVGGDWLNTEDAELAFCKLTPSGNLVTDFANNGIWKMNIVSGGLPNRSESLRNVIENSNGEIVLTGIIAAGGPPPSLEAFVCKIHSGGILNTSFGTDGFYDYGHINPFEPLLVEKILQNGSKYIVAFQNDKIVSITHNGTLDTSFNNTGVFFCENYYYYMDVKLQDTNKLLLGGYSNGNAAIIRLNIPYEVSIKETPYSENRITIYPNPAKDYLYFNSEQRFEIMDIQGRILLRSENPMQSVNVSRLKAGVYFIKTITGANTQIQKVIKL